MARRFEIEGTITRQYSRFCATRTQLVVSLLRPANDTDLVCHFLASLNDLFRYALLNLSESYMVGITIQNRGNQNDKPIGISFRRKDQLAADVILFLVQKVSQSNCRFNALVKLIMTVHSVIMPVGFGRGMKSRGRPLSVMALLKRSVVVVKAAENCLAHAIIIAIAKVENFPNYASFRDGIKIRPVVRKLLADTCIALSGGGGIPKLIIFQEHFLEYKHRLSSSGM